jgi:pimeloyl-ACP methyl ester carboxylesterase
MAYAANPIDGVRTWFEDDGGEGPPVVFLAGFADPLEVSRASALAASLDGRCRRVFVDHRGHGRSDKPHDPAAYDLRTRVADVVAVLDALGVQRTHLVGSSWGARLGFAFGEYEAERVLSLTLGGNQPYAWRLDTPLARGVERWVRAGVEGGPAAFVAAYESLLGEPLPARERAWLLDNDMTALEAAWRSVLVEGRVAAGLSHWRMPCVIYAGSDDAMHDDARRAAREIPGATFVMIEGSSHLTADRDVAAVLPHVLELLRHHADES